MAGKNDDIAKALAALQNGDIGTGLGTGIGTGLNQPAAPVETPKVAPEKRQTPKPVGRSEAAAEVPAKPRERPASPVKSSTPRQAAPVVRAEPIVAREPAPVPPPPPPEPKRARPAVPTRSAQPVAKQASPSFADNDAPVEEEQIDLGTDLRGVSKPRPAPRRSSAPMSASVGYRQTLIPAALAMGVCLIGLAGWWFMLPADRVARAAPNWLGFAAIGLGVVFLGLGVLNALALKTQLARK